MCEPNQPVDPTKDKRIRVGFYSIAPNPGRRLDLGHGDRVSRARWCRVDPGASPPATALAEIYEVPLPGYSPRGGDIDSKGVMWSALASGHLGAFDRSKCKGPLNGPLATGKHCPEGWTLYPLPGPQLGGVEDAGSGETPYYAWVDQHNTFGLGKDVPFATGNQNDSLIALVDGKPVNLVVPYPMGFWAKAPRRPHRRSECRLERPRRLVEHRQPHALPSRRRQGHDAEDRALPDAARSAGAVSDARAAARQEPRNIA